MKIMGLLLVIALIAIIVQYILNWFVGDRDKVTENNKQGELKSSASTYKPTSYSSNSKSNKPTTSSYKPTSINSNSYTQKSINSLNTRNESWDYSYDPYLTFDKKSSFNADTSTQFKTYSKYSSTYYYLYDYYPLNRYPDLEYEHDRNRKMVWNFKDGYNYDTVADKISSALINKYGKDILSSKTLCIIPASTSYKTSDRFESFCKVVSQNTGIQNGYNIISNAQERDATHDTGNRNIDHTSYNHFGDVYGKDIILFDDVTTSGKSFKNIKSTLLNKGAKSVTGIFLAKTVSNRNYSNNSYYDNDHYNYYN